jgi:hypothetical protein
MPTIESARLWYPASDPVHGFDHVLRVYRLAERLAQAEGADLEIVRAAALLHDAEGREPRGESGEWSAVGDQRSAINNQQSSIINPEGGGVIISSFSGKGLSQKKTPVKYGRSLG